MTTTKLAPQIVGDSSIGFSVKIPQPIDDESSASFLDTDPSIAGIRARRASSAADYDITTAKIAETEMDQQKYRLPDHANTNGTKAVLETRYAHLRRESSDSCEVPPPPISKDEPLHQSTPSESSNDVQSYFNPFGLQRTGSIYTLSRVSFASQLAQLTSLQLPDADSLSNKISAIATSQAAFKALTGAAEQIQSWIQKASEVLGRLDADDDVEWAAAGGREGLTEVDNAISRFEDLINVYVSAIEELQSRDDISSVPTEELKAVVTQVETILAEWAKVRKTLTGVKGQVEIAMEWEELWNVVLGDIGNEMDALSKLVFEMEEKRHKSLSAEAVEDGVDIGELETIVEDTPPVSSRLQAKNRFSITTAFPLSPNSPQTPTSAQDDSCLLALFARMQPLRASLDFLPMRLSTFHARAEKAFPTACVELETRREGLETSWKRLEKDADSLRRELGEDRWLLVFRGAGRQAEKMSESVDRSLTKLQEALDSGAQWKNPSLTGKKIENYESKKIHYGPAIERVLAIIEKGVKDRLTVNGEIVRVHSELQSKWESIKGQMVQLDELLGELQMDKKNQQLRDSISSLMSNDRSTIGSLNDTPGSSPASSVVMSNLNGGLDQLATNGKTRPSSHIPQLNGRRNISTSGGTNQPPRKGLTSRASSYGLPSGRVSPSPRARGGSATPTGNRSMRSALPRSDSKPRWNSSVKTEDGLTGHNFKPLTLTTPSPHAKSRTSVIPQSAPPALAHSPLSKESKIPLRSPVIPDTQSSPILGPPTPSKVVQNKTQRTSLLVSSPGPYSQLSLSSPAIKPRLQTQPSISSLGSSRRISLQHPMMGASQPATHNNSIRRPSSSLTTNRRTSLLPQPSARGRLDSSVTGRESPQAMAGAVAAMRGTSQNSADSKGKEKPKWR